MNFKVNHYRLFLLSMSALVLFATSCKQKEQTMNQEEKFLVTSPLSKDTSVIQSYVCQIRSSQHIELRALEKGYIQDIYVDEGQVVKKGQLMFKIMPVVYNAEYQKALAEASFAEIEYKNTKQLSDKNVVSSNELALAKAKLEKAQAELQLASAHLKFTEIRAPFEGIMDHLMVRIGSLVNEGDLLTNVSDNSKMWVYFNVPESEYLNYKMRYKSNQKTNVRLLMANNELFSHSGVIQTIEADFNNETGNIDFRATFPNPDALLRHGETGEIQMESPMKKALIIPQKATFEILEKKYVYVVGKDNRVIQREVTIASELPDIYIVKSGIKPGEKILLEGIRKVNDGDKINYHYQEPDEVLNHLKVYFE